MLIKPRFELWHTMATCVALMLCIGITKLPLNDYSAAAPRMGMDIIFSGWWRPGLLIMGLMSCWYLVRELFRQAVLLWKSLRKMFS